MAGRKGAEQNMAQHYSLRPAITNRSSWPRAAFDCQVWAEREPTNRTRRWVVWLRVGPTSNAKLPTLPQYMYMVLP